MITVIAGVQRIDAKIDSESPNAIAGWIMNATENYLKPETVESARTGLVAAIRGDMKSLSSAMSKARGEANTIVGLCTKFEEDIVAKVFAESHGFQGPNRMSISF